MFYTTRIIDNKIGVIDTTDGVEEFYDAEQLESFSKMGIIIHKSDDMSKYVFFVWHFYMNSVEFGSSRFEEVISFMKGASNKFCGSRYDYANSLKKNYNTLKTLCFSIDLDNMFDDKDLLLQDLKDLYFSNYREYRSDINRDRCVRIARKWFLNEANIIKYYG